MLIDVGKLELFLKTGFGNDLNCIFSEKAAHPVLRIRLMNSDDKPDEVFFTVFAILILCYCHNQSGWFCTFRNISYLGNGRTNR